MWARWGPFCYDPSGVCGNFVLLFLALSPSERLERSWLVSRSHARVVLDRPDGVLADLFFHREVDALSDAVARLHASFATHAVAHTKSHGRHQAWARALNYAARGAGIENRRGTHASDARMDRRGARRA